MELAELLMISVAAVWVAILFVYLLKKDIKDRKYNKVLKTKEQMFREDKNKF